TANSEVRSSIQRTIHHSAPATATATPTYQSHGGSATWASRTARMTPNRVRSMAFEYRIQCRRVLFSNRASGRRWRSTYPSQAALVPPAWAVKHAQAPCSASCTLPTILAPGLTRVLSPSSFHLDGQTSLVFLAT